MKQIDMGLVGGHHIGPLFEINKTRAPTLKGFDGSRRINGMVRRSRERRATPPGTDMGVVRDLYRLARIYTAALGVRFSVDHDIPLIHDYVCGLHVPANLFVRPLTSNVSKGNRWNPDQLEIF